ncbi:transcription initiation factor TFIID subunit 7-like [Carlito syrichta]|uniref:Transcription initiation factor TFIID subunit 7-like n=1 Tax=Carlito syrichta TaxID=1868482 RepID=A0A1U7TJM7_CARSF|nr:transcription initiation factor TFIID subunit 7-like [Carlito syrichta]
MERPEGPLPKSSEYEPIPIASASEETSHQEPQVPVDHGVEAACNSSTRIAGNHGTPTPADLAVSTDAESSTQAAPLTSENSLEGKEMSKSQDELPHELESQFILRLPPEHACIVRSLVHSRSVTMKDKLKIDLSPDKRHATVEIEDVSLTAKLVDLPCVIGSLKTLDKKTFYKTANISQMLVCTADDGDQHSSPEEPVTPTDLTEIEKKEKEKQKKYIWKHGITPPLKNVRKKRFRKIKKKPADCKQVEEASFTEPTDSPDVEREVKRLLCSDAEAVSARWEVIAEGETKEIECQGFIPGFELSPGTSEYKLGHISSAYGMLREVSSDSSGHSGDHDDEDEDDDEKQEEEEDDEEEDEEEEEEEEEEEDSEDLERELQAKFIESGQYEAKEGAGPIVMNIQKQIYYMEKRLYKIQNKAQRQKDLIMKVENQILKKHLRTMLEQLKLQEKQTNEQLISLQEQLTCFLK